MNVMKKRILAILFSVIMVFASLQPTAEAQAVEASGSINTTNVTLYALEDGWKEYISIPESLNTSYLLKVTESGTPTFSVISGDSVTVSATGLIEPATTVMYWNGNIGTSWSTGDPNEVKRVEYNFGTSVVQVKVGRTTYQVNVTVKDYASYYAEQKMNEYIRDNMNSAMTEVEQLESICEFVASYDYDVSYSGYTGLVVAGGGDCWASTSAILYMCRQVGLKAHIRYAANDAGAGAGHRNVAVQIGDQVYIADAGYTGTAPRYYSVYKENTGFCYQILDDESAEIIQYDGFSENIVVPSAIDGYTVTSIGEKAFWYGENYSSNEITSVTLPDTIKTIKDSAFNSCKNITDINIPENVTSIGTFAFTACQKLENINVSSRNASFSSVNGVLYDKGVTCLLCYPAGKEGICDIPSTVTRIESYSFAYGNGISSVIIPKSVLSIGEGAFGDCNGLKNIYFAGNAPEFSDYVFYGDKITAYYPKGNATWTTSKQGDYSGTVTWTQWDASKGVIPEFDLTYSQVTLNQTVYVYNGAERRPSVTVKMKDKTLSPQTDYTVSYQNNKEIGTADVIITGKGVYKGSIKKTFKINPGTTSVKQKSSSYTSAIAMTWGKVSGATGYEVYRADKKNGKYTLVKRTTATSFKNTKLKAGKTYYYKVRAYTTTHNTNVYGSFSGVTPMGTKTAKPAIKVTAGNKRAKIVWKKVTGASGYEVYMSTKKSGKYKKIKTGTSKTVSYTKTKLKKGRKYYFKVRTYRTVNGKKIYSSWSNIKNVKVK